MLPASGREGDAPEWPLTTPIGREVEVWGLLWSKPQAVEWERLGQELEVALYVRSLVEAEQPRSPAAVRTIVVRMAENLGLSLPGMARNRWTIAPVEQARTQAPASRKSRARLKVVDNAMEGSKSTG